MTVRSFILGTDWWTDCDDAVAIRLLARAHRAGSIRLLGIGINACMPDSAASMTAFLAGEGLRLPLGIDPEATDFGGTPPYQARLAAACTPRVENSDLEDAQRLYIRLLREAREPVEILEIGYPQVLAGVLRQEPELFAGKVKRVWMMAGKWDENPGRENNFARNARASRAGAYLCANCSAPITFLGWEVAHSILVGGTLPETDPLHRALLDHGSPNGRSAWDPMLAELAIIGDEKQAGYSAVYGHACVDPQSGYNTFTEAAAGPHCYVKKLLPDEVYAERIEKALTRQQSCECFE